MAFQPVRDILETMRRRGLRLTASDSEALFDAEQADAYYCSECRQYFASPCDEIARAEALKKKHEEERHSNG